jgi:Zn-dependent peptidase ImmA (M78 family)/transcriptional regulator with XRE-family HTH domain
VRDPATFDPWRLQLAREALGRTKVELATEIGVSAAAISQFEHGSSRPALATLKRLALALDVPSSFFEHRPPLVREAQASTPFFRSLRSTPQILRTKARARALLVRETVAVLEQSVRLPEVRLPRELYVDESAERDELETAAATARAQLGVPGGPVANVVRLMEAHGVCVSRLRVTDERVSAFSQWIDGRPVVMLSSDKMDAARSRFDAAHELGHLVLHPEPEAGNALLERQADAFAAAFLMPARDIAAQLPRRFSLASYLELKRVWGVSVAALLYRGRSLGVITETAYRRAVITMSSQYGRRREPGDLGPAERALMLQRAAELAASPHDPVIYLAGATRLHVTTIQEILDEPITHAQELTPEALMRDPR